MNRQTLLVIAVGIVLLALALAWGFSRSQRAGELSERLARVEAELEALKADLQRLQAELESVRQERDALAAQLEEREAELASLKEQLQSLQTGPEASGLPSQGRSTHAVAADFDRDGDLDLYIANGFNYNEDNIYALNNGDGSFTLVDLDEYGLPRGGASTGVVAADFDRDGDLDLYVANSLDQDNWLLLNDGTGHFTLVEPDAAGLPRKGYSNGNPVAADFDDDGDLDLFVPNSEVSFYALNNGDGTFTTIDLDAVGIPTGATSVAAVAADFDRDGDLDLYVCNGIRAMSGQPIPEDDYYLLNDGDGTFTAVELDAAGLPRGGTSSGAVVADFNRDGALDLFIVRSDPYEENVYALGRGDGTFQLVDVTKAGLALGSGVMSFGAAAGDLDRDGDLDLVIANGGISGRQDNIVALNRGDGRFVPLKPQAVDLPTRGSNLDVLLADFDRDGDLDLLLTDVNFVQPNVYALNVGDGRFQLLK